MSSVLSLEQLERRPAITLFALGCLIATAYVVAVTIFSSGQGRIINGDAVQYYAYLRSLVFDRDVNFINDYELLFESSQERNVWLSARTTTGYAVNFMSIGPALLALPFFLITCGVIACVRLAGGSVAFDGISLPFQLSAGIAGVVYATLGIYLCHRICERLFPPRPALWGTLVAWLATPAIYYSLVSPAYSHATSLFAVSLFVHYWVRTMGGHRVERYVLLGALGGVAALVRWQNALIMMVPMAELVWQWRHEKASVRSLAICAGASGVTALVIFLPQLLAWKQIYGQWLLTPQGDEFMRWSDPQIVAVLFSTNHGLFMWTPAVLLAVLGLGVCVTRHPLIGWSSLGVVLMTVYVNAVVVDWWAGEAFGARRFVGNTPFFAIGLSALGSMNLWTVRARLCRLAATVLIVYNLLFLVQYQLVMRGHRDLVTYPTTTRQILIDRMILPWLLVRRWIG